MLSTELGGVLGAIVLGTCFLSTGRPAAAQNSGPAAPAAAISPEQAVISLLPYRLRAADAPAGYTLRDAGESTAVGISAASDSPAETFAGYVDAGFLVRSNVQLVPSAQPAAIPNATGAFSAWYLKDTTSAHAFVIGTTLGFRDTENFSAKQVGLSATLGEASSAWDVTLTPSGQPPQGYYAIRRQHGQIAFGLSSVPQPAGQEIQSDAESLALALAAIESARPAATPNLAPLTPPATEAQCLQAALRLKPLLTTPMAAPQGYKHSSSGFSTRAGAVWSASDAIAELERQDETLGALVGVGTEFTSQQNRSLSLGAYADLFTDARAALAELTDDTMPSGWTGAQIDAPVQLGDATIAYRGSGSASDGEPQESTSIGWTHGPLLITVYMDGPAGSTSMDQLADFARQTEAQAEAAGIASPARTLRTGWSLVAGTGQLLVGDQFDPTIYTFQPGDGAYEVSSGHSPLQTGYGYWVDVTGDTPTPLRAGSSAPYHVTAPAGQPLLVGNPSGTQTAMVDGADSVLTYDPVDGYQQTNTLRPGQGAWVMSQRGGAITVPPQGTPPASKVRPIASDKGYSFQTPADWQKGAGPSGFTRVDLAAYSPDETGIAFVQTIPFPAGSTVNVLSGLSSTISDLQAQDPTEAVVAAAAPLTPEVAGADNAAYAVTTFTGSVTGKTHVVISVAANRNETVYIFTVDVYLDDFNLNQERVWQIADSLRLASTGGS